MSHAVLTGPIEGSVTLADGTVIDVGPQLVMVDSPAQAAEVAHLVGQRYADEGHPHHRDGVPFVYNPEPPAPVEIAEG